MNSLPEPVLDDQPDFVALYHAAWEIARRKVKRGTPANGFAPAFMGEAFSNHLFQWDTCLMALFARHAPGELPAHPALDNFYGRQHADGFICRELVEANGEDYFDKESDQSVNPPLFAWAELGFAEITGDLTHARAALPNLVRYFDWLKANRRAKFGMYWQSNLGSGMDNSPRDADGWVDLTAQQAHAAECISILAGRLGEAALAARFVRERRAILRVLNTRCWSDSDGLYLDTFPSGRLSHQKTAAAFWPMLAGAPDVQRAAALVAALGNERLFNRPHLFPTLSADHQAYEPRGFYWLGGVWAPTNYMIVKGLQRYGFDDFARAASDNHLRHVAAVWRDTGTIWENYAPEWVERGEKARADFVGWSGLGPIAMLIENVIGLRQNALDNTITWHLREAGGRYGVIGLPFGPHRVDLIAEGGAITVTSPAALTLVTLKDGARTIHPVETGTTIIRYQ